MTEPLLGAAPPLWAAGGRDPGLSACPEELSLQRRKLMVGSLSWQQSSFCFLCIWVVSPPNLLTPLLSFRVCEGGPSAAHRSPHSIPVRDRCWRPLPVRAPEAQRSPEVIQNPESRRRPLALQSRLIRAPSPCALAAGFIVGRHDLPVILAS